MNNSTEQYVKTLKEGSERNSSLLTNRRLQKAINILLHFNSNQLWVDYFGIK